MNIEQNLQNTKKIPSSNLFADMIKFIVALSMRMFSNISNIE